MAQHAAAGHTQRRMSCGGGELAPHLSCLLARTLPCTPHTQAKLASKAPFSQYGELERQGARVVWGSPTDPATWPPGAFDVVYDNNGKDLESCWPLMDANVVRGGRCASSPALRVAAAVGERGAREARLAHCACSAPSPHPCTHRTRALTSRAA